MGLSLSEQEHCRDGHGGGSCSPEEEPSRNQGEGWTKHARSNKDRDNKDIFNVFDSIGGVYRL